MRDVLNIVVPVYNEGSNFPSLWECLCRQLRADFKMYVVYDFPEDDTLPAVQEIIDRGEQRIRLVQNSFRSGVVGAMRTGFAEVEHGPVLVVMADLSDDLQQVDNMLELYRDGFQVIAGSRYMRRGAIQGGPFVKQLLSRIAGVTLHWIRGIPTHDATNAFKIYDAVMLHALDLRSRGGFEINLEITVKAFLAGYRITEIPTVWRERTAGKSNFKLWAWLPHYLRWYIYAFRPRQSDVEQPQSCG